MAKFYDVQIHWKDKSVTKGRGIGNNAAWQCKCGDILLGPHEDLYPVPACLGCGRRFNILRGKRPRFVQRVVER